MSRMIQEKTRVLITAYVGWFFFKMLLIPNWEISQINTVINNLNEIGKHPDLYILIFIAFSWFYQKKVSKYFYKFIWNDSYLFVSQKMYGWLNLPRNTSGDYDKEIMNKFYRIVNTNKDLTEKSHLIMVCGTVVSGTFDLMLFSFVIAFLNFIWFAVVADTHRFMISILLIFFGTGFFILFKLSIKIHLHRVKQQVDYIEANKNEFFRS